MNKRFFLPLIIFISLPIFLCSSDDMKKVFSEYPYQKIVSYLDNAQNVKDIDELGMNSLMYAALFNNDVRVIELLLKLGIIES